MSIKPIRRSKNLTDLERTQMCTLLQSAGSNLKVSRTDFELVALTYACSLNSIMKVWKRGRDTIAYSPDLLKGKSKIKGKKSKEKIDSYAVYKKMEAAPCRKRYTLRSLARIMGVSASTLCRMRQSNDIMATTNAINPCWRRQACANWFRSFCRRFNNALLPDVRRNSSQIEMILHDMSVPADLTVS